MITIDSIPDIAEKAVCETHGEFEFRYQPWINNKFLVLNNCQDCAAIAVEQQKIKDQQEQIQKDKERIEKKKLDCGISRRHFTCSFENYDCDTQKKSESKSMVESYAKAVIDGSSGCLVMAGTVGTGKTHLATALAVKAIDAGIRCRMIKMSELIRQIKDSWRKGSDQSESDVIDYFSRIHLLIIDEIGVQFGSDTEKLFISEIIDNRYLDLLPTVMISNLDINGIKQCIGERSFDRLKEDGGKIAAFDWESMRGKK